MAIFSQQQAQSLINAYNGIPTYQVPGGITWTNGKADSTGFSQLSGYHTAGQNQYQNYSNALGLNYSVDEYVPAYARNYNLNTASGQAQYAADQAQAENVRRYYEILAGYRSILDSSANAVDSAYNRAYSSNLQNLTSRGLTGTTILTNVQNQNAVNRERDRQDAYNQNLEKMLQFMQSRNTSAETPAGYYNMGYTSGQAGAKI